MPGMPDLPIRGLGFVPGFGHYSAMPLSRMPRLGVARARNRRIPGQLAAIRSRAQATKRATSRSRPHPEALERTLHTL